MKKILLLVVLLAPCLPSFVVGVKSQAQFNEQQRELMLNKRFKQWCDQNGYNYYGMSENDSEALWCDVWMELDDYFDAVDSIDSVLSVQTMLNQSM